MAEEHRCPKCGEPMIYSYQPNSYFCPDCSFGSKPNYFIRNKLGVLIGYSHNRKGPYYLYGKVRKVKELPSDTTIHLERFKVVEQC